MSTELSQNNKISSTLQYGEQNLRSLEANNEKIVGYGKEQYSREGRRMQSEASSRNSTQGFKNKSLHTSEKPKPFILKK